MLTPEEIYSKAKEIREQKNAFFQDTDVKEVDLQEAKETLLKQRSKFELFLFKTGFKDKKLWDFIPLIIIPSILAFIAFHFQTILKQKDQQIAEQKSNLDKQLADDKAQREIWDNYRKEMNELIDKGLLNANRHSTLYTKAQSATINSLIHLKPVEQKSVIKYLQTQRLDNLDEGRGILFEIPMSGSNLSKSDLSGAKFVNSHLEAADFTEANLIGVVFQKTNLQLGNFTKSQLYGTYFEKNNLKGANFTNANLQSAIITGSNLHEVTLTGVDLSEAILLNVDMSKTKGLRLEQIHNSKQPLICKVTLPPSIKIDPDRDCESLPNELMKRDTMRFKTLKDAEDYVKN